MKILFPTWKEAMEFWHNKGIKVEGPTALFLIHEGSWPCYEEGSRRYKGGTGRYFLSDHRTGEFVYLTRSNVTLN